ncbi:MAG: DUF1043 family protein [Gammaproteobacteria bacterium]
MLSIAIGELLMMIVALLLLGGLVGYLLGGGRRGGDDGADAKVAALEEEVASYKQGVTTHFQETADLMQQMTAQYRALYAHMAQGAVALCDAPEEHPRLEEFKRLGHALDEAARAAAADATDDMADAQDTSDERVDAAATDTTRGVAGDETDREDRPAEDDPGHQEDAAQRPREA